MRRISYGTGKRPEMGGDLFEDPCVLGNLPMGFGTVADQVRDMGEKVGRLFNDRLRVRSNHAALECIINEFVSIWTGLRFLVTTGPRVKPFRERPIGL